MTLISFFLLFLIDYYSCFVTVFAKQKPAPKRGGVYFLTEGVAFG